MLINLHNKYIAKTLKGWVTEQLRAGTTGPIGWPVLMSSQLRAPHPGDHFIRTKPLKSCKPCWHACKSHFLCRWATENMDCVSLSEYERWVKMEELFGYLLFRQSQKLPEDRASSGSPAEALNYLVTTAVEFVSALENTNATYKCKDLQRVPAAGLSSITIII
jgi:hypothetical protein